MTQEIELPFENSLETITWEIITEAYKLGKEDRQAIGYGVKNMITHIENLQDFYASLEESDQGLPRSEIKRKEKYLIN